MRLELDSIEFRNGVEPYLYPLSLSLQPATVTVLLGATQAGKTTLMRVMAGLDKPSAGRVNVDGQDVTGVPVRERNIAMVYQQFINYPSMSVFENIASPLRLRGGHSRDVITKKANEIAEKLRISPFLQRLPSELSGGQQQRVALARAMAKNAPLMLLDEPLVNLDYKLREELREELASLFVGGSTVVYATTEPTEALLLGGWTAVIVAGRLLQYGPTANVYHRPDSIEVARAFSDPPMNLIAGGAQSFGANLSALMPAAGADTTLGLRAVALRTNERPGDQSLNSIVEIAEISGSDTYVHLQTEAGALVMQLPGVHVLPLRATLKLFYSPSDLYVFDAAGKLRHAPERKEG